MSEYTPTTDEIREVWGRHSRYMEFDDWLAEHDRVVKSKAWAEGFAEGKWVSNPYREETE